MSDRNAPRVSEAELHAYLDGQLEPNRQEAVEVYLAENPEDAERIGAYDRINTALHEAFDRVLLEPLPASLTRKAEPERRGGLIWRVAASVAWVAVGAVIGWVVHGLVWTEPGPAFRHLAQQAAMAHAVYTPEVRHPVEVTADQEAHLTAWLSKRLGNPIRAPHLGSIGFDLVGGRMLPADGTPAAQFMYEDGTGKRLTLYIRTGRWNNESTAFRYVLEAGIGVFYWVDGPLGYALSGEVSKDRLLDAATAAYHHLNP